MYAIASPQIPFSPVYELFEKYSLLHILLGNIYVILLR